jgi:glucose/mannose transport system substrate-binding protein
MISKIALSVATAAIASVFSAAPLFAQDLTADVVHVWTSAGERGAAAVLAKRFTDAGGKWVDDAVAGSTGPVRTSVSRILAGDPPSATQFSSSRDHVDLLDKGMLMDVDSVATAEHWRDVLPEPLIDAISSNGKIYLAPVGVHVPNWIWYNKAVLEKVGIQPPTTLDDSFFAALDKVKAAGIIPFALSGQPAQERFVFEGFMLGLGGQEYWNAVWRKKDDAVIRSDKTRHVFESFKRLKGYVDEGYAGRAWNPTLNMVITGQAAFDVLGDWAKAEFAAAGKTIGKDFDCSLIANTMIIHGDFFGFPVENNPDKTKAQLLLAKVVEDPETQKEFAKAKGAIPPRTDVDVAGFDSCAQKAVSAFRDPTRVVGNARSYLSPAAVGDYIDLLSEYFDDPDMTSDQAVDKFADIVENGLN